MRSTMLWARLLGRAPSSASGPGVLAGSRGVRQHGRGGSRRSRRPWVVSGGSPAVTGHRGRRGLVPTIRSASVVTYLLYTETPVSVYNGCVRAVLYSRVSTDEQAVSGLGLEAQRDRMRAAVAARGWTIAAELADEGVSGSLSPASRPGLSAALQSLRGRHADVLVVAKLDRLTRTTRDLLDLLDESERGRFAVLALDSDVDTTTAAGRLVATMMGGVAEWERRVIGERTKAALAVKKAQGARLGRPVIVPGEIRARVGELRASGLSMGKICDRINAEGLRTTVGTEWTRAGVQRIVRSLKLDAKAETARQARVWDGAP